MSTRGANPPPLFFAMGACLLILGLSLQFFGYPYGPTIRGWPYLLFAWTAMAGGVLCIVAGFYYWFKGRSR